MLFINHLFLKSIVRAKSHWR